MNNFSRIFHYNSDSLGTVLFTLRLLRFSKINVKDKYHFSSHNHFLFEFAIPLKCNYECNLNKKRFFINPGELLFIQPFDTHEDFYTKDSEMIFLVFDLRDYIGDAWKHGIFSSSTNLQNRVLNISANQYLANLLSLLQENEHSGFYGHMMSQGIAGALFWNIIRNIDPSLMSYEFRNKLGSSIFQQKVEIYFIKNITGKIDINDLCNELGLSRRTLEYKFHKELGISPIKAFNALKVKYASQLLVNGEQISDVSDRLGFSDQFSFSTMFKRITGQSPKSFQKESILRKTT